MRYNSQTMVVVYTKNNCQPCIATKRKLNALQVPFEERNVETLEGAYNEVIELGYQQVPVVVANGEHWSGFDPTRLSNIV